MHPRAVVVREGDRRREVVERARVDVASLERDERRTVAGGERVGQRVDPDPTLRVRGHLVRRAEAEVSQCEVDRVVPFRTDENAHTRRALKAVAADVPPDAAQHLVSADRQAGEVRHHPARDGAHRGARGQAEQVDQPPLDRLPSRGGGRRHRTQSRVLVPGRSQSAAIATG